MPVAERLDTKPTTYVANVLSLQPDPSELSLGNGGPGGNGGNGGNVKIIYSKIGNVTISNDNFIIQNSGGPMGNGGPAGLGGAGGTGGGCTDPKAAVRPAGTPGRAGLIGNIGSGGKNGTTMISVQ